MMFLQLPNEIMLSIFSHLGFEDKLNLKNTCAKINDLLTNAVLYENLDLLNSKYMVDNDNSRDNASDIMVRKLINNNQFEGSLVKVLQLNINELSGPVRSQLSNIFPNVNRVITLKKEQKQSSSDYDYERSYMDSMENTLVKWRNTIEKIDSRYDWNVLKKDIFLSKYPRLTELDLGAVGNVLRGCVGENPSPWSFFENAPLLATLTLRGAEINLNVLEVIHSSFPLIKSLILCNTNFKLEKEMDLPRSILPASTVSYLKVFNAIHLNSTNLVLDYILKKYTNLKQLVYGIHPQYDYNLKSSDDFKIENYWFSDADFKDMVSAEIANSELTFPVYSAVESKFFSNLPKSMTTLTLYINNIENAVASLAESNSNITVLNLIDEDKNYQRVWKNPNMLNHFKNLPSLRILKIRFKSSVIAFTSQSISYNISKLFIDLYDVSFSIGWILSMFPSLEELHINSSMYSYLDLTESDIRGNYDDSNHYDEDIIPRKIYPNLRIINISRCFIHYRLFDFIKAAAPDLDEMRICASPPTSSASKEVRRKYDLFNWKRGDL